MNQIILLVPKLGGVTKTGSGRDEDGLGRLSLEVARIGRDQTEGLNGTE